jgi:hypothetical protein
MHFCILCGLTVLMGTGQLSPPLFKDADMGALYAQCDAPVSLHFPQYTVCINASERNLANS